MTHHLQTLDYLVAHHEVDNGCGIGTGGKYLCLSSAEFTAGLCPLIISASSSICTAQTSETGILEAVEVETQCCTISNGTDNLACEHVIDRAQSREVSVVCKLNEFIADKHDVLTHHAIIKHENIFHETIFFVP